MTPLLAAEDIVHHLLDYQRPGSLTSHQFLLIGIAIFTIVLFTLMNLRTTEVPPKKGIFGLLEFGMVWLRDEVVYPWLGPERGRKYLGFFWTLFFFILFCNLFGLLPFPFNPWERTATGNLAVTGALAFIIFLVTQLAGMRQHGYLKYWIHLVPAGTPIFLWPLLFVIEFIGLFTKPFALTVRLFANMTGGHAALIALFGFLYFVPHSNRGVLGVPTTIASFGFILFILLLETLIALIQAYIFTILSAIFVSLAVAEEH